MMMMVIVRVLRLLLILLILRIERMTRAVEATWCARELATRHHRSLRRRNANLIEHSVFDFGDALQPFEEGVVESKIDPCTDGCVLHNMTLGGFALLDDEHACQASDDGAPCKRSSVARSSSEERILQCKILFQLLQLSSTHHHGYPAGGPKYSYPPGPKNSGE